VALCAILPQAPANLKPLTGRHVMTTVYPHSVFSSSCGCGLLRGYNVKCYIYISLCIALIGIGATGPQPTGATQHKGNEDEGGGDPFKL